MLVYIDIALAAPPMFTLEWGVAPAVAALPQLMLFAAAMLACVAPALAQEPSEPEAATEEPAAPASEPLVVTPEPQPAAQPLVVTPAGEAEAASEPASRDAVELDRIEVTASKRLKAQRDIPGSVGAIRGKDLEDMRAQELSDYLKLVPGIALVDTGPDQQVPVVRGVASSTGINQFTIYTTGVFLEEMPFNDLFLPLSLPDMHPFDLERVEVLKGPQGTLFGASALGGAIRYITEKPNLGIWQGKASYTLAANAHSEDLSPTGAAALNVPLGSTVAARLVGVWHEDKGIYDSLPNGDDPNTPEQEGNTRDQKDIDRFEQLTGRALLRWDATDRLSVSGLYFTQDTAQDDASNSNRPDRFSRNDVPFPSPVNSEFSGTNVTATYDFDFGTALYSGNLLEKAFNVRSQNEAALPDELGNQEDASWYTYIDGTITGTTHELRFSGDSENWEWLVGAAQMDYDQDYFQFTPNPGAADAGYYANPPEDPEDVAEADRPVQFLWAVIDATGQERSVFGEATRRLGEFWEVTLGARVFETEIDAHSIFQGAQITALSGSTETRSHQVMNDSGVNPKAALRYLHSRNLQVYALASRGFQFGGFQISPAVANIEQASEMKGFKFGPYKSSVLWNYEVGLRTEWLDRRLRFDLAGFYLDWDDLQLTVQVPLNPVPIPVPPGSDIPRDVPLEVVVNVAAAHSEGVEAALEVLPFAGAKFTSSAAWISALTDVEFDPDHEDGPVPAGTRLPSTPRFQWANVFSYEYGLPYFTSWQGNFALTHSHIGGSPNEIRKVKDVGAYDTLDVRFGLTRPGIAWIPEIGLGVNNLTDVRGVAAYSGDGGAVNSYYLIRPRTTLMTLAWSY
jgi:iron complex outermembrane recepter protein